MVSAWICSIVFPTDQQEWSGNLEVEYPFLARRLDTEKHLGCPTCISLGPNGTYFANFGGRSFWSLPDAIKDGLDMDSVDRLFLGRSSAYYAVYQGGSARWRLSGNYSYSDDLSNYLKEAKSPAKVSEQLEPLLESAQTYTSRRSPSIW